LAEVDPDAEPLMLMSILTGRELEFLASLRTDWRRLYCNELARLLRERDNPRDTRHQAHAIAPQIQARDRLHCEPAGQILAFAPKYRARTKT
jgi:hypothetical protein